MLGLVLILWKIPDKTTKADDLEEATTLARKLKRIDVLGAVVLASAISAFLLALDFAAKEAPWWHVLISALLALFLTTIFYFVEQRWAAEPILPIKLITKRAAFTSYLIAGFQIAAQFSLFYAVPIYFQIAGGTTISAAGLRLVPAVVGNATGGLLSGYIISKTGRYKTLTIAASATASVGYLLVLIRWHGSTSWPEVLYIFFGGFGSGVILSTTFIHLAASLESNEMAIAGTTLYLATNLFLLVGIQLSTTILHARLRASLDADLDAVRHKRKVRYRSVVTMLSMPRVNLLTDVRPLDHRACCLQCAIHQTLGTGGESDRH